MTSFKRYILHFLVSLRSPSLPCDPVPRQVTRTRGALDLRSHQDEGGRGDDGRGEVGTGLMHGFRSMIHDVSSISAFRRDPVARLPPGLVMNPRARASRHAVCSSCHGTRFTSWNCKLCLFLSSVSFNDTRKILWKLQNANCDKTVVCL